MGAIELKSAAVVVVGAGTMGIGIAQVAATAGHCVRVIDIGEDALARGKAALGNSLQSLVKRGKLSEEQKQAIQNGINWSTDLGDAAGAGIAIEAIVERADAKSNLFQKLFDVMGPDTIFATNTSSLSIAQLAENLSEPRRFVGLHFFNPVPVMKLVEIIPGPDTLPAVTDAATALMVSWGKRPVIARDVPGFIVNRVARPYYAEGFAALSDEIAPEIIDRALTAAGGFRMGPLALADMIGHDINFSVACSVFDAYGGKTQFRSQPAQKLLVDAGTLGRKSGRGVYDYDCDAPAAPSEPRGKSLSAIRVGAAPSVLAPLLESAWAAGLTIQQDDALAVDLLIDDVPAALGDGRSLAARQDVDVLIDWARDFATAPVIAFTARSDDAAAVASGLIQLAGREALRIRDRPGQVVLRTLAQLANAAADAAKDEVASPRGIDEAMMFGANHPEGPIAWAERVGSGPVVQALENIAAELADEMYRPSDYLRSLK